MNKFVNSFEKQHEYIKNIMKMKRISIILGALLCGMDRFIATELDMPVLLAKEPMDCAALGIGQLAEDLELLQRMCQSAPQRDDEEETAF